MFKIRLFNFKSFEEKVIAAENKLLKEKEYIGQVGASNTGYTLSEGFTNTDKVRFKKTKFKIYDDRILIERHKTFINIRDIKEIFQDKRHEALIILNNGDVIAISGIHRIEDEIVELTAFINILNRLIEKNRLNNSSSSIENNKNESSRNSEDKFDRLIKLGEMYGKGLLSDDEFTSLKNELLSGNKNDTSNALKDNVDNSKICKNCGADLFPGDVFCSECGTHLNNNKTIYDMLLQR